ncbi:hypothetical protein EC973_004721, partial [Apophysomyces ossiformis]
PVPFEALLPFAMIGTFFVITASGLSVTKYYANERKPTRHNLDNWDIQMMERDRRLTGTIRGQSSNPVAPLAFATNR